MGGRRKFSVQYKREAAATRVAPSPQASLRGQWARPGEAPHRACSFRRLIERSSSSLLPPDISLKEFCVRYRPHFVRAPAHPGEVSLR